MFPSFSSSFGPTAPEHWRSTSTHQPLIFFHLLPLPTLLCDLQDTSLQLNDNVIRFLRSRLHLPPQLPPDLLLHNNFARRTGATSGNIFGTDLIFLSISNFPLSLLFETLPIYPAFFVSHHGIFGVTPSSGRAQLCNVFWSRNEISWSTLCFYSCNACFILCFGGGNVCYFFLFFLLGELDCVKVMGSRRGLWEELSWDSKKCNVCGRCSAIPVFCVSYFSVVSFLSQVEQDGASRKE